MFVLWIICTLVVGAVTALMALVGAFKKSAGVWIVAGAVIDAALYFLLVGMPK